MKKNGRNKASGWKGGEGKRCIQELGEEK